MLATALGLAILGAILGTLIVKGLGGLSFSVFTQSTPAPQSEGGLANAIFGSVVMTAIGIGVGAPIGMLAGTYLAEYGRRNKFTSVVRFINDVLLSAPSIVIGLFVYTVIVARMGRFSSLRTIVRSVRWPWNGGQGDIRAHPPVEPARGQWVGARRRWR